MTSGTGLLLLKRQTGSAPLGSRADDRQTTQTCWRASHGSAAPQAAAGWAKMMFAFANGAVDGKSRASGEDKGRGSLLLRLFARRTDDHHVGGSMLHANRRRVEQLGADGRLRLKHATARLFETRLLLTPSGTEGSSTHTHTHAHTHTHSTQHSPATRTVYVGGAISNRVSSGGGCSRYADALRLVLALQLAVPVHSETRMRRQ
ncbi:hypothetical protein COCHEDRAFT_1035230 [Bipolaris maydis C5]|uniref:Uncharacterized protein n=2 Tax=Cochliobolus heterostrophus TaxID=5016 RepID=M2UCP6_COCH5|nr:hypothetical protein COCHEDRAFT_1035230 [Bipolaris maydis C5]KAJ5028897.1 hypothetical protein J3E73DRAFT_255427 [Bipolaris maydis]KAJ6208563.1 hypothetical protein PSV09DRAFT_1035230 [Bipolaris maydis]